MALPQNVETKILELIQNNKGLKKEYEELSKRYRSNDKNKSVKNNLQALAYAMGRMPATHEVCKKVLEEVKYLNPQTATDVGAGTGAATLALLETFNIKQINCLELSNQMLNIGKLLTCEHKNICWQPFNILTDTIPTADLTICSYMLNEVEANLKEATQKLFNSFNKVLIVIEAGTPHGFGIINKVRTLAIENNLNIIAPCSSNKPCPINSNDWCAFTTRVNRNNILQQIKQGSLSYEDENYSYLIVTKEKQSNSYARILRHPEILKGHINLKVCENGNIKQVTITKTMGEKYKLAKKLNSGDKFEF